MKGQGVVQALGRNVEQVGGNTKKRQKVEKAAVARDEGWWRGRQSSDNDYIRGKLRRIRAPGKKKKP